MWCNDKFEGVLFRNDSRHNDRIECATKQAVMTVAQWLKNQIIRGPLVIGKKNVSDGFMLTWCNFKFDGFCSIWTLIKHIFIVGSALSSLLSNNLSKRYFSVHLLKELIKLQTQL